MRRAFNFIPTVADERSEPVESRGRIPLLVIPGPINANDPTKRLSDTVLLTAALSAQWKKDISALREVPWLASVNAMVSQPSRILCRSLSLSQKTGAARPSVCSRLLESIAGEAHPVADEEIEHCKDVVGIAYVGKHRTLTTNT